MRCLPYFVLLATFVLGSTASAQSASAPPAPATPSATPAPASKQQTKPAPAAPASAPGSGQSAAKPAVRPVPKANPEGTKLLDQVVKQLQTRERQWLQTKFWQEADVQGLSFDAQGDYVSAPDNRLHLNLKVTLGDSGGILKIISDGTIIWEYMQVGAEPAMVTKLDLAKVLESIKGQTGEKQAKEEFFQSQSFAGLFPLVQSIQQRMVITNQEKVVYKGRTMTRLTAEWSPQVTQMMVPPGQPWPAYLAQRCHLYLEPVDDQKLLWPSRLEWWGPSPPRPGDVLLLQMEFRDPKFQAIPPQQSAELFKFNPGPGEIPDKTPQMTEQMKFRVQQLAQQQKPAEKTPPAAPTGKSETR